MRPLGSAAQKLPITNRTPSVIVFDVNETLSNMSPIAQRFDEVGAPAFLADTWFATVLRDGFALAAAGGTAAFLQIGSHLARESLRDQTLNRPIDEAVDHIMTGFGALQLHPDVAAGIHGLKQRQLRLVTLSNGSADLARTLLAQAHLEHEFDALLTVENAPAWKPVRSSYEYAAHACGVSLVDMLLIAVHPWDIHGAAQAGLSTGWLNRNNATYPDYFAAPDYTARTLGELADQLA